MIELVETHSSAFHKCSGFSVKISQVTEDTGIVSAVAVCEQCLYERPDFMLALPAIGDIVLLPKWDEVASWWPDWVTSEKTMRELREESKGPRPSWAEASMKVGTGKNTLVSSIMLEVVGSVLDGDAPETI